jgi:hypothetical protein
MSHSFIDGLDGAPVAAPDSLADGIGSSADYGYETLARDLAILGPVADRFGLICAWTCPGLYHLGRYDVLGSQGQSGEVWELSYNIAGEPGSEVLLAIAESLEAIAETIVADAVRRQKLMDQQL